eukprot:364222-Chlamydomonas_euryale.AAC.4
MVLGQELRRWDVLPPAPWCWVRSCGAGTCCHQHHGAGSGAVPKGCTQQLTRRTVPVGQGCRRRVSQKDVTNGARGRPAGTRLAEPPPLTPTRRAERSLHRARAWRVSHTGAGNAAHKLPARCKKPNGGPSWAVQVGLPLVPPPRRQHAADPRQRDCNSLDILNQVVASALIFTYAKPAPPPKNNEAATAWRPHLYPCATLRAYSSTAACFCARVRPAFCLTSTMSCSLRCNSSYMHTAKLNTSACRGSRGVKQSRRCGV